MWKREVPGIQWLRFSTSTAGGMGLLPGLGIKIPHTVQCSKQNTHTLGEEKMPYSSTRQLSTLNSIQKKTGCRNIATGEKHLHIQEQKMCNIYDYFNNTLCLLKVQSTKMSTLEILKLRHSKLLKAG